MRLAGAAHLYLLKYTRVSLDPFVNIWKVHYSIEITHPCLMLAKHALNKKRLFDGDVFDTDPCCVLDLKLQCLGDCFQI